MARPFLLLFFTVFFFGNASLFASGSVVLLPLIPESDQYKYSWIGESVPELVTEILSSHGIFILDRDQRLRAYKDLSIRENSHRTLATNLKVALDLDAEFAVFGNYTINEATSIAESPISIHVRVTNVRNWRNLGEIHVQGKLADLGVLETRLAFLLLKAIEPSTALSEAEFLGSHPPVRLDALESYIRGLLAPNDEARHRFWTQAVRLDETFPAPAYQLGLYYWAKANHRQAANWLRKLPPTYSQFREAQFMLGVCEFRLGRYPEAEEQFRELYNALPMMEVANNLAVTLSRQGKADAMDLLLFAVNSDPEDPDYRFNLGHVLWKQERYDDAADRFREVLDLSPEDDEATRMLGRSLQKEASRPARSAVQNLDRLKDAFDEAEYQQLLTRSRSESAVSTAPSARIPPPAPALLDAQPKPAEAAKP